MVVLIRTEKKEEEIIAIMLASISQLFNRSAAIRQGCKSAMHWSSRITRAVRFDLLVCMVFLQECSVEKFAIKSIIFNAR